MSENQRQKVLELKALAAKGLMFCSDDVTWLCGLIEANHLRHTGRTIEEACWKRE